MYLLNISLRTGALRQTRAWAFCSSEFATAFNVCSAEALALLSDVIMSLLLLLKTSACGWFGAGHVPLGAGDCAFAALARASIPLRANPTPGSEDGGTRRCGRQFHNASSSCCGGGMLQAPHPLRDYSK